MPVVEGPLWCKLLVPSHFAGRASALSASWEGAVIGKGGKNMTEVEKQTNCTVRMSTVNSCFPGTSDRMLAIGASTMSGWEAQGAECVA